MLQYFHQKNLVLNLHSIKVRCFLTGNRMRPATQSYKTGEEVECKEGVWLY
jgi:hypothetical protein